MQLRVGYELIYDCPQVTPMLNIHHTRAGEMVVPDHLTTNRLFPSPPIAMLSAIRAAG